MITPHPIPLDLLLPLALLFLAGCCMVIGAAGLYRVSRPQAPAPTPYVAPVISMPALRTALCPRCRLRVLTTHDGALSRHVLSWTSTLCDGSGERP